MSVYMVYKVGGAMPTHEIHTLFEAEKEIVRLQNIKGYKGETFRLMMSVIDYKKEEK